MICPICYNKVDEEQCLGCGISMSEDEWILLQADTYEDIVGHLLKSKNDPRGREQRRVRVALRNIQKWAIKNNIGVIHA